MIVVKFTCDRCGTRRFPVEVRSRGEGEEIKAFVDRVMVRCQACHLARSPRCRGRRLDLYLPYNQDTQRVGEEPPAAPS